LYETTHRKQPIPFRRQFTLVEMLVVIAIVLLLTLLPPHLKPGEIGGSKRVRAEHPFTSPNPS